MRLAVIILPIMAFLASRPLLAGSSAIKMPIANINPSVMRLGWNTDELYASAHKRDKLFSVTDPSPELDAFDSQFPLFINRLSQSGCVIVSAIPIYSEIIGAHEPRMSGLWIILQHPSVDPSPEDAQLLAHELHTPSPPNTPSAPIVTEPTTQARTTPVVIKPKIP